MRKLALPSFNLFAILHDCGMAAASFLMALYLRLSMRMFSIPQDYLIACTAGFATILLVVMLYNRSYRRVWRYTSLNDLLTLARAATVAMILFYGGLFLITRLDMIPRSVPFIHWMTLMLCLCGARTLTRIVSDRTVRHRLLGRSLRRVPVLLVGVNAQAEMFIRESERSVDFPYTPVGIVDDKTRERGREIHGVPIYGRLDELGYILKKLERKGRAPQRLLLTEPSLEREAFEALLEVADASNLTIARLPSLSELKAGEQVQELHPVAVEDILGRPPAVLDREAMAKFVQGNRVLVTGAGGSIGAELVRQVAAQKPSEILLYELSEFALYEIDRELARTCPQVTRHAVIGDVRDAAQLERVFAEFAPEIVFHAAALKHVPLSEANAEQAVLTNILGTKQVADACLKHKVRAMVHISTDKAVNPSSVMGATKRISEMYCQLLAQQWSDTRFITVRFGNVLNSAGSVVPLFQEQIKAGGPVTVTHRDMLRYFMTIGEAVQLILQSAVMGIEEPEHAPIFVLDMGEPVRIEELACQMIRLAGFTPYKDIKIAYTGLRPGEKLVEELFHDEESLLPTRHKSIRLARARGFEAEALSPALELLFEAAYHGKGKQLPMLLKQVVAEYQWEPLKSGTV